MNESKKEAPRVETLEQALAQISVLELQNAELKKRLTFDKLTGEFGIYREEAAKEKAMELLLANNFPTAGVVRMDMSNLKQINNDHSHDDGNLAIKSFGQFLMVTVALLKQDPEIKEAFAFRVYDQGDEFGLIVFGASTQRIDEIGQTMKAQAPVLKIKEKEIELGFTVGCVSTEDFIIKEELEMFEGKSLKERAAQTWNILNSRADFEERMSRKMEKAQNNNG